MARRKQSIKPAKGNACGDKVRYYNEPAALMFGRRLHLRPYRCPFCPGWHLTSQGKH